MESGFDGFIPKPIDVRQLNTILKKFIRDKQPFESVTPANKEKGVRAYGANESVNPELAEIFIRDAYKSIKILETIYENNAYGDDDVRLYTINVHAMKSALANVGEKELSAFASRLEQAGRDNDAAVMTAETPMFLGELRRVIEEFTPRREDGGKAAEGERGYLHEKLLVIIQACEGHDRKTAKDAIVELRQRQWSRPIEETLGTMAENLLNGDFEELAIIAKKIINPTE
jgi:HPt (histidine-containing phosphotransfer) domain-containing protein